MSRISYKYLKKKKETNLTHGEFYFGCTNRSNLRVLINEFFLSTKSITVKIYHSLSVYILIIVFEE